MSPDRDSGRLGDDDLDVDERDAAPRSIFSALWFRVLLAMLVLGVAAAIAVPYVLDTQTLKISAAKSAPVPPGPAAPVTAAPAAPPSAPAVTPPAPETPATPPATAAPTTPPPSAVTARPKLDAASAPVAKSTAKPATTKSATVAKASESAKPAPRAEKPAPKAAEVTPRTAGAAPKAEATPKAPEVAKASAGEAAKPSPAKAAGGGKAYWVQVGAFKDAETAKRIAARLREQGLRVEESPLTTTAAAPRASTPPPAADRYDVLVSGAAAADVEARLAPKGFKGESTANGVVVRPSLALREAVALSRDLADAGLSVQVRRIGGPAPSAALAPAPPPSAPTGGPTLYRVRVGGFAERAAAVDAMKQLEGKGFKPFIARGNE